MPTYSYECVKCNHTFDVFHMMSAQPRVKCERCQSRCRKLLGAGAGIIFKGSGFYETDFKEKKGSPPAEEKKAEAKTGDAQAGKGEGKSDTKSPSGDKTGGPGKGAEKNS